MKTCIWCLKTEESTTFDRRAHTFPVSLGGKNICENVCDSCNSYFGQASNLSPAIEVVLKEVLNISKYLLLAQLNKIKQRYKSIYFDIDLKNKRIKHKQKYKLRSGFQEQIGRKFKQGMFKVFLEERERQCKDAIDNRFDFIREFARYNLGDYPVFILQPEYQAVFFSFSDIENPELRFTEYSSEQDENYRMFDYPIMGHNFVLPTSKSYSLLFDNYLRHLRNGNYKRHVLVEIIKVTDIDFTFKNLDS